jgi:hypothetical protein
MRNLIKIPSGGETKVGAGTDWRGHAALGVPATRAIVRRRRPETKTNHA